MQTTCSKCHALSFITNSGGNSRAEWDALIQSMVALPGPERTTVVDYLAKNYPPTARVAATIVPGRRTSTSRSGWCRRSGRGRTIRSSTADGNLWWTGQYASRLGRLDLEDGRPEGVPAQDRRLRAARPRRGQGRQHLVHRHQQELHRQARPEDRRHHRIPADRARCARPAHADLRLRRDAVLHHPVRLRRSAQSLRPER